MTQWLNIISNAQSDNTEFEFDEQYERFKKESKIRNADALNWKTSQMVFQW